MTFQLSKISVWKSCVCHWVWHLRILTLWVWHFRSYLVKILRTPLGRIPYNMPCFLRFCEDCDHDDNPYKMPYFWISPHRTHREHDRSSHKMSYFWISTHRTHREHEQNEICKNIDPKKKKSRGSVLDTGRGLSPPSNPHTVLTAQVDPRITLS